jgi:hypothetical protein
MIKVEASIQCVDSESELVSLLDQVVRLVLSSYNGQDSEAEFEVITKDGQLKLNLVANKQEKFNGVEVNCCK